MDKISPKSKKSLSPKRRYPVFNQKAFRQSSFVTSWSISQPKQSYDALTDPHASYYFSNNAVKKHLKSFKKGVKVDQKNFHQRKRLKSLIERKIQQNFNEYICPKTLVYQMEVADPNLLTKISLKNLGLNQRKTKKYFTASNHKSSELKKLPSINGQSEIMKDNPQTEKVQKTHKTKESQQFSSKKKNTNNQFSKRSIKVTEQLHNKRHDKFMSYIEQKRKQLETMKKKVEDPNIDNCQQD